MLLALDTATTTASIALFDRDKQQLLAEETWLARRRQTTELLPALEQMMTRLNVRTAQLSAIAVTTGPGSFTGVRIGISVAKGLALGLTEAPHVIGIPTLSVTAAPLHALAGVCPANLEIWACIQAGRGRYNWAPFQPGHLTAHPSKDEHRVGKVEQLQAALAQITHPIWLIGEIDPTLTAAVANLPHVAVVDPVSGLRRASNLARLADRMLATGASPQLAELAPIYLQELY